MSEWISVLDVHIDIFFLFFFFGFWAKYCKMKFTGDKYQVLDLTINCPQQDRCYSEQFIQCESMIWCIPQNSKCAVSVLVPEMKEVMVLSCPAQSTPRELCSESRDRQAGQLERDHLGEDGRAQGTSKLLFMCVLRTTLRPVCKLQGHTEQYKDNPWTSQSFHAWTGLCVRVPVAAGFWAYTGI